MNIDALHALTLESDNTESSVTVNQRALIDKVLSRYSSENTLLRELLQNSDDANATSVKITYESSAKQPDDATDIHNRMTKRVVVKNNGQIFRPEDWSRLSRIAEGNPDEAKIGAFGVGFYSVFSICEDPFVTSGDTGLAFYWRKDQLFTRTAKLPSKDEWTTFALNMRQESELPNLRNLTKFLATSLTFSRSLKHIELWLDDTNLCTIERNAMPSGRIAIPPTLSTTTSGKMLKITSVESSSVQISATYLESTQIAALPISTQSRFLSLFTSNKAKASSQDPTLRTSSKIFLRVLTGHITTSVNKSFSAELQRATKKPPPKTTKIELVAINAAEYNASTQTAPIFENLLTFPKQGRIYIGFPTHQTTGFSGHVGAPCIIPTVERESIDLVDRFIKLWNFEVLRAIGLLSRIAYHIEFQNVQTIEDAIHTLKFFGMTTATPQNIDQTIEGSFFESSNVMPIFSSAGVQPSNIVRFSDPRIKFLQNTPQLPAALSEQVPHFVERLRGLGYIESVSIGDIKKDLQNRILDAMQATSFLNYCAAIAPEIDGAALASLLQSGLIVTDDGSTPIHLGQISSYSISKVFSPGTPLPKSCLPLTISSPLGLFELQALGWHELSVLDWLKFVVSCTSNRQEATKNITTDSDFAVQVLSTTSRVFDSMATEERAQVIQLLKDRTCMPTKNRGMCRPDQTYFHTIKLFDDLPLILTMKGVKERFLLALGVRKTIELDYIFKRLHSDDQWTLYDLITYLASIRKDIPGRDMERLKTSAIATAESSTAPTTIDALYEPSDILRNLGLPVISWPKGRWKSQSEESALLSILGLKKLPPVNALLSLASTSPDPTIRNRALTYFMLNFINHNYGATYDARTTSYAFVPTEDGTLRLPKETFCDPACQLFEFAVLRKDLVSRASLLGVLPHPPVEILVQTILQKPATSYARAAAQFSFIAGLHPTFSKKQVDSISQVSFIPLEKNGKFERYIQPRNCFFRQDKSESVYVQIFDCIDFGNPANMFLRSIGVRDEPSTTQIANMLVKDAAHIWTICGSEEKYKSLLLHIARDSDSLKRDINLWQAMKKSQFLLAYRYVDARLTNGEKAKAEQETDELATINTSLRKANDVVIIDDMIFFNSFRFDIYSSPQEQYLEDFYRELGSPLISKITVDQPLTSGRIVTNEMTTQLRADVLERLTVFLSESRTKQSKDIRELNDKLTVVMQEKVACQRELHLGSLQKTKYVQVSAVTQEEGRRIVLVVNKNPDRYDIAVALCKIVLRSAKPGDYLLLETLLTNTLRTLKARGYPVDRILQRQEQEKKEQQKLHEEQRRKELDQSSQQQGNMPTVAQDVKTSSSAAALTTPSHGLAPPIITPSMSSSASGGGTFMANLKKGLGLTSNSGAQTQSDPTPSPNVRANSVRDNSRPPQTIQSRPVSERLVTSQASIDRELHRAIQLSRNSDSTNIYSAGVVDNVQEAKSFCDTKPAQDLVLAATLSDGSKFFVNRHMDVPHVLENQLANATTFTQILGRIGQIYRVNSGSINICFDPSSPTIAFNRTGTIYCNLHFYNQLHSSLSVDNISQAYIYWYVTLAHELAHNLVSEHSSEHEFYMESMITLYMKPLIALLGQSGGPPRYSV